MRRHVKMLLARILGMTCLKAEDEWDDCRYWVATYGLKPCGNCRWRYGL